MLLIFDMSSMFESCYLLTSLDLSNFDTKNVIDMNSLFYGSSKLKYIDISYFKYNDTSKDSSYINLFNSLPSSGTIKISQNFYDIIKDEVPKNWEIKFNE